MSDATAQSVERLALANRLLDAMEFDTNRERFATRQMPGVSAEGVASYKAFTALQAKYLTPQQLRPAVARAYATRFTDSELRQLIKFFESPVGRNFTAAQPMIADTIQQVMADVLREHADELRETLFKAPPDTSRRTPE